MTRKFLIPASLALAAASALLLGACKAADNAGSGGAGAVVSGPTAKPGDSAHGPVGTTEVNADGVRRVNAAELQKLVEGGRVAIYDTRVKAAYEQEHIRGALSLPQNEADGRAGELPRDKTLVFYCT